MRVLGVDCGFNTGWGLIADAAGKPRSGSRTVRGSSKEMGKAGRAFDEIVRTIILDCRPVDAIAFAAPFVGVVYPKPFFVNGRKIWRKPQPIGPDQIRGLFGFTTILEMIADELSITAYEVPEPEARRAFMTGVPRKSSDIKLAVMAACALRGWPVTDHHAADALCVADFALSMLRPKSAHERTPLFVGGKHAGAQAETRSMAAGTGRKTERVAGKR